MTNYASTRVSWPLLGQLGFRKRAGEIFTLPLAEGLIGWLGLNRATEQMPTGVVEIHPILGIRHDEVERVVAELSEMRFHPYIPPTVSKPLSVLFPDREYHAWYFGPTTADASARSMAEAIARYGLPFLISNAGLPAVCELIERRVGHDHMLAYRRPVAWQLAGRPDLAARGMGEAEEGLGQRRDLAADHLRRFITAFRGRFGSP